MTPRAFPLPDHDLDPIERRLAAVPLEQLLRELGRADVATVPPPARQGA